jgi:hypothetical protein
MKKLLVLLLPVVLVFTSCDDYGKKVKINDKLTVYYKGEGVNESDAKKLGDFLEKNSGENKGEIAAQVMKEGDTYVVRMPVNEEAYNKDKDRFEKLFWYMQDLVSESVFDGKKTKIILTDNKLKDKLTLDELVKIDVGNGHYVFLKGNDIKEKDAKEIGEKFEKEKIFPYTQGAVLLTKEKGNLFVRFLPNPDQMQQNKEVYFATLANLQYLVAKYVLNQDVKLVVMDEEFNDIKDFGDLTAQQKNLLDQRMTGQPADPYTQYEQPQYSNDQTTGDNPNQ